MRLEPGPRNAITDIAGLRVGNAEDTRVKTGVTAILCDTPAVAAVMVLGGAPGTRETDALDPANTVEAVHAVALAGGSAFGLDAASGIQALLRQRGVGVKVREHRIPIVPAAILFDLSNGGDKGWGRWPPYRELGWQAAEAAGADFSLGTAGAGCGAVTAGLKGGLGTASALLPGGVTVAALVAVNAVGSATVGATRHFWAAPFEIGDEFGGLGLPSPFPAGATDMALKFRDGNVVQSNTTIGVIATDARLGKGGAKRLAMAAHDGFARALWPAHTPADGDLVFGLATGHAGPVEGEQMIALCAAAASVMARAIARGVHAATPAPGDPYPCWSQRT